MYVIDIDILLIYFINIDLCTSAINIIKLSLIRVQSAKGTYELFNCSMLGYLKI